MESELDCAITVCDLDGGIFAGTVREASGPTGFEIAGEKLRLLESFDEFEISTRHKRFES